MGAMVQLFAGPVVEKIIKIGFEYLKDQIRWQTGMKDELENLLKNIPKIQAVFDYASSHELIKGQNAALNKWLWQLRDAIDEADDVLDEIECRDREKQLTKSKKRRTVRSVMKYMKKKLVIIGERAIKNDPTLKRLEKVVRELYKISAGAAIFLDLAKEAKHEHLEQQLELYKARETGSLPTYDLIGRGQEKEEIMDWLKKSSNDPQTSNDSQTTLYNNISLLSVVGQAGMGKTTLLQYAYNDEFTNENFDLKMWVCVSNNFDVKRVIADMLESLTNKRSRLETLDALQKNLQSEVKNNKFLLVLDDIWEEEVEVQYKRKWEKVLAPLAFGNLGSKILLTTHMESAASIISQIINKNYKMLKLEGLNKEDCLLLLQRCAFANVENLTGHENLMPIATKIVEKLNGFPLAVKIIGGVLKGYRDTSHWNKILRNDIESPSDILLVIKLSYKFLSRALQNCLSFCCIFPLDYEFDKDDLIRMWIALGFIQQDKGKTVKDTAERYFDTLVEKFLFDKFPTSYGKIYYRFQDLLHEMFRPISTQEYFSIVGDDEKLLLNTPDTIRHLYVQTRNLHVLIQVKKFKKLRSFIFVTENEDLVGELAEICKTFRSIRLICINAPKLMAEGFVDLKHLRYLKMFIYR